MMITEGIVDNRPFAPMSDQVPILQQSELMRDGRLGNPNQDSQISHTTRPFSQQVEDFQACGVTKHMKRLCKDSH